MDAAQLVQLGEVCVRLAYGSRPWLARITGSDPEFGLRREFLPKTFAPGVVAFTVSEPGIYQFQDFSMPDYPGSSQLILASGYVLIGASGSVSPVSRNMVATLVTKI